MSSIGMSTRWGLAIGAVCAVSCGGMSGTHGGHTSLPVDCRNGNSDPHCASMPMPGTIGTGPILDAGINPVSNCALDMAHNRLAILANLDDGTNGIVMGVDLTTGNRSIVSGVWQDPRTGMTSTGSGPSIAYGRWVQVAPDGSYWVLTSQGTGSNIVLVRIDPATGARTTLFDSSTHTAMSDACSSLSGGRSLSFAIGSDNTAYVTNLPPGLLLQVYAIRNNTCTLVSCTNCTPPTGQGPMINGANYEDLQFGTGGQLLGLVAEDFSIVQINPMNGNVSRISGSSVGTGDDLGTDAMTQLGGSIYTVANPTDPSEPMTITTVDPATGNRTQTPAPAGTFIEHGVEGCWLGVPGTTYIATSSGPIVGFYEPSTGNTMILSN